MRPPVSVERIERRIYFIRDQKVMLDSDLAELYEVTTGNLNLAVRRNHRRFPEDFMFRLNPEEAVSRAQREARERSLPIGEIDGGEFSWISLSVSKRCAQRCSVAE